jgi:pyridoxal phosphate enzyme (YggS family)
MPPASQNPQQQLRDTYQRITDAIAAAAGRSNRRPGDIVAIAVTKTAGPDQIRQLLEMGHRDFGENRVQQLSQRVVQLQEYVARRHTFSPPDQPAPAESKGVRPGAAAGARAPASAQAPGAELVTPRWHMIGHLQRNKVKVVVPLVRLIHSVDSLRLAEELHALGARLAARTDVRTAPRIDPRILPHAGRDQAGGDFAIDMLIQVNSSGEESKFGVAPPAVLHLAEQIDSMMHLRLRGLMTIAPYSDNPEDSRPVFARTYELFDEMRSAHLGGAHCNILSMGMTGDFEVAIEEGSNMVRIGRGFFGEGSVPPDEPGEGSARSARDADADDEDTGEPTESTDGSDPSEGGSDRDEGPRSAEARRKQRQAQDRAVRARIARENRSARGGQR